MTAADTASPSSFSRHLHRGTPAYRRAVLAMFFAGLATFALLYCVQPVLPQLAEQFGVSPAASSLALSFSTGGLAVCLLLAGALSEAWGRKGVMLAGLVAAGLLGLLSACTDAWPLLLAARLLLGLALSCLTALAMAYLGEEVAPSSLPAAMALLIAGNAFGGLAGRLLSGVLAEWGGWRLAVGGIAVLALAAAAAFAWLLPPSRHFRAQPLALAGLVGNYVEHLRNPALVRLLLLAFLIMGGFVAVFNYLAFHLQAPPYGLSPAVVGLLSLVYLAGMGSAQVAARLVARHGPARVLRGGVAIALAGVAGLALPWLPAVLAGLVLLTAGFFAAHAVASGEVSRQARGARAQASALYLGAFYLGSSVLGSLGGWLWAAGGWGALLAAVAALFLLAGWCARPGRPG